MLKKNLTAIKGELLFYFSDSILDICVRKEESGEEELDYESYFLDLAPYYQDILKIQTLDQLEEFINEADLNEKGMGLGYFLKKYK